MSRAVVVRYRVKADALDENIELVRAVQELAATRPEGQRYSTYRVDWRTFVHVAVVDGTENPLEGLAAFHKFAAGIGERCEEGPQPLGGELLVTYPS